MVSILITNHKSFKDILLATEKFANCFNIDFSQDGMKMDILSTDHTSLVSISLKPSYFEEYKLQDRDVTIGLSIIELIKILKILSEKDDILRIIYDSNQIAPTLLIEGYNSKLGLERSFLLSLMDYDHEHLGIPDIDYPTRLEMKSEILKTIMRDTESLKTGDSIIINVKENDTAIISSGQHPCAINNKLKADSNTCIMTDSERSITVASKYVSAVTSCDSAAPRINILIADDSPLCLEYDMNEKGYVKFYIAPKISEEQENETKKRKI